jgi:hypothetical protein
MVIKDTSNSITEHDVVLIHVNGKPTIFARIESIEADKADETGVWWKVSFTGLSIPLQKWSWVLDSNHICEAEFSMGGSAHQIEIIAPDKPIIPQAALKAVETKEEPVVTVSILGETVKVGVKRPKVVPLKPEFAKHCPGYEEPTEPTEPEVA